MFPATKDYIDDRPLLHNNVVVQTDEITANSIIKKTEVVLEKNKRGIKLAFTDIDKIYSTLVEQLKKKEENDNYCFYNPIQ